MSPTVSRVRAPAALCALCRPKITDQPIFGRVSRETASLCAVVRPLPRPTASLQSAQLATFGPTTTESGSISREEGRASVGRAHRVHKNADFGKLNQRPLTHPVPHWSSLSRPDEPDRWSSLSGPGTAAFRAPYASRETPSIWSTNCSSRHHTHHERTLCRSQLSDQSLRPWFHVKRRL